MTEKVIKRTSSSPDELREFPKGQLKLYNDVNGLTFGIATVQPGWSWSGCLKEHVGGESCTAPHTQYHVSGRLGVRMDDGTEYEFGPGDISHLPPGHDAWVIGDEAVTVVDITGMAQYAVAHEHGDK